MDGTLSLDGLAPTINVPSSPDGPCPDYDSLGGRAKRERRQVDSLFVLSSFPHPMTHFTSRPRVKMMLRGSIGSG